MPKAPVEVFWRGAGGTECVLRSTDRGWGSCRDCEGRPSLEARARLRREDRPADREPLATGRRTVAVSHRATRFPARSARPVTTGRYFSANRRESIIFDL